MIAVIVALLTVQVALASPYYDAVVVEGRQDSEGFDINEAFEQDDCLLPAMAGPCRAGIPMFYYNAESGKCIKFRYGGCGGNGNRFQSRVTCERRCTGVQSSGSKPAAVTAECQRDPAELRCGGQGCFASRDQEGCYQCRCASDATSTVSPTDRPRPDLCELPPARGHCRALLPRWTFDARTGQCREFRFGGCDGNGNNFMTEAECQNMCGGHRRNKQGIIDRYDALEEQEDGQLQTSSSQYSGTTDYTSAAASFLRYLYQRFWQ
ncbi:hypothetical protein B566_EDAN009010 [Ephemera danica]|nr:hypothetical protein B566_EDAN009010 [Ephemera danica]